MLDGNDLVGAWSLPVPMNSQHVGTLWFVALATAFPRSTIF